MAEASALPPVQSGNAKQASLVSIKDSLGPDVNIETMMSTYMANLND